MQAKKEERALIPINVDEMIDNVNKDTPVVVNANIELTKINYEASTTIKASNKHYIMEHPSLNNVPEGGEDSCMMIIDQ